MGAPHDGQEACLDAIEEGIRTGRPFGIGVLRYGSEAVVLAHPMDVVATRPQDGFLISADDFGLYGFGDSVASAYEDFSGCVISAYRLFGQNEDEVAVAVRRYVEG